MGGEDECTGSGVSLTGAILTFSIAHWCLWVAFRSSDRCSSIFGASVIGASDSESLLLDESEEDVSELSLSCPGSLLDCCSGSESELGSLEDDPEDEVSSLSDGGSSENVDELESELSNES